MDLNLRVDSFISAQGAWKIEVLKELFMQDDIDRILSFPPSIALEDSWAWAHTKECGYSVKSGNWLISNMSAINNHQDNANQILNELKT
ncbi:hypothetical protein V5N11_030876 [Cardamine amara subsp. amara]|uniref:Uncharacterized protein n=1 Tax=Cardamine amara subsp. amara TaxID=228776 RepID=A0ABD1BUC6_CARAN